MNLDTDVSKSVHAAVNSVGHEKLGNGAKNSEVLFRLTVFYLYMLVLRPNKKKTVFQNPFSERLRTLANVFFKAVVPARPEPDSAVRSTVRRWFRVNQSHRHKSLSG